MFSSKKTQSFLKALDDEQGAGPGFYSQPGHRLKASLS